MSLVSVIVPTYNRRETIQAAIASVQRQTFTDWELIVVDDGSTDDTAALIEGSDPRLVLIRQKNQGVPRCVYALVLLPDQHETGVRALDQGGRVVGGTVVYDDQLPIRESLPLHACDSGLNCFPAVVGRDDHGNEAHPRGLLSESSCIQINVYDPHCPHTPSLDSQTVVR